MRAVFAVIFVAVASAAVVSATPLTRQKRGVGTFSATGMPFGGGFGGAFAGAGFNPMGFYPFFGDGFPFRVMPIPMPMPVMPQFTFPTFKNWYEGPNVCKEQKIVNSQMPEDVVPDSWKDDLPNVNSDFNHEHESCKGTDKKYVCIKRIMGNNGEAKVQATKYECCHGFVRDPSGDPGCVESTGSSQGSDGRLTAKDPTYYLYTGKSGSSSSSSSMSSSSTNLEKVPLQ